MPGKTSKMEIYVKTKINKKGMFNYCKIYCVVQTFEIFEFYFIILRIFIMSNEKFCYKRFFQVKNNKPSG